MSKYETSLSKYATKDSEYIRLKEEIEDIRPPFFRDTDRIIYSLSYVKYLDKTQVFSFNNLDVISKRMTHVQYVSKIARTIGRALGLNEDLIEAIALGHDIGHTPLGHVGEQFLNEICQKEGIGRFAHNTQSVRTLMSIDNSGEGRNLCVQTLDGILCHNGEFLNKKYYPKSKTKEEFIKEYELSFEKDFNDKVLIPMTMEGCVVRISDMVSYIGRDIEDAIRLKVIKEEDIPENIVNTLGKTNKEIINSIILDIIKNSYEKPYLELSNKVYKTIKETKEYNYEHIYYKVNSKEKLSKYKNMFKKVYEYNLNNIERENRNSSLYKNFLDNQNEEYMKENPKRIVIDYIAGMTDEYFLKEYNDIEGI